VGFSDFWFCRVSQEGSELLNVFHVLIPFRESPLADPEDGFMKPLSMIFLIVCTLSVIAVPVISNAADQPARQLLLDLVLRNFPRPVFKAAFVIAKPHPIGY